MWDGILNYNVHPLLVLLTDQFFVLSLFLSSTSHMLYHCIQLTDAVIVVRETIILEIICRFIETNGVGHTDRLDLKKFTEVEPASYISPLILTLIQNLIPSGISLITSELITKYLYIVFVPFSIIYVYKDRIHSHWFNKIPFFGIRFCEIHHCHGITSHIIPDTHKF